MRKNYKAMLADEQEMNNSYYYLEKTQKGTKTMKNTNTNKTTTTAKRTTKKAETKATTTAPVEPIYEIGSNRYEQVNAMLDRTACLEEVALAKRFIVDEKAKYNMSEEIYKYYIDKLIVISNRILLDTMVNENSKYEIVKK